MAEPPAFSAIPVIETARLRLRAHHADDLTDCAAMWADPQVTRHIGGRPATEQEAWSKMLRYLGLWALVGYGYWAIEEKSTGHFAGELGFADFKRQMEPSIQGIPELGWALVPRVRGQGYATEAVRAALAWGDEHLAARESVCIISPENQASRRVAEKGGFQLLRATTYNGEPTLVYQRSFRSAGQA